MTNLSNGHILIVDDEPINLDILVDIFEDDYEISIAVNGEQALELAHRVRPDLILLDVMMPGINGYEVCTNLKLDSATADIPVIFITGLSEDQAESQGLDVGAVDYVTKPINPKIIRRRVSNHLELKKARDRLAQLSVTDGLTGLANRRCFDQVLESEIQRLRRMNVGCISLIMIDVDHFKKYNDTYGHISGDNCLRTVAGAIQSTVSRTTDLAARYGGEEFACILPATPLAGAEELAERIRLAVLGLNIPHAASTTASMVTVSLGVAVVTGEAVGENLTSVIAAADAMLYRAKNTGRNRVVASAPDVSSLHKLIAASVVTETLHSQ
ncbi:two-component system, chemotaxis family, response regulator WspR [Azospirillaceae bacterium]